MKTQLSQCRRSIFRHAIIAACGVASVLTQTSEAATKSAKTAPPPDLNGIWSNDEMGFVNPQLDANGSVLCIVGCPPKPAAADAAPAAPRPARVPPSRPKYKPEFAAKVKDLSDRQVTTDPALKCGNPGLPRIGPPEGIVQQPNQVVFLYEDLSGSFWRVIPIDGRPHRADAEESFLGDSIGRWEGDTLVVESQKFTDETWLTDNGAFHTTGLKVTERLRRVGDTIEYQAVADDPAVLIEPWQMRARVIKKSDKPLNEPIPCVEMDLDHVVDGTHHDNPR
jgi:hypothetical protein